MASSINTVVIEGHLGKDAETRFAGNTEITSFSVAVNKSYKDRNGEWADRTSWIPVTKWKASDYLKGLLIKGQKVTVSGELVQESWEKDGKTYSKVYVNADRISTHKKIEGTESDYSEGSSNDDLPF